LLNFTSPESQHPGFCCNQTDFMNLTTLELTDESVYHNKTMWRVVTEGSLLSLISLCAVFGNSLVIISVYSNRKLRTITNCFVVSLATADLLVGLLVLPLSIKVEITGSWGLGTIICDMWITFDVMLCTASILNLCCISVDRFFAITNPLVYATKRSKKLAIIMIGVVWVVSLIITCPPIFGWQEDGRGEGEDFCYLTKDPGYIVYSALGSFYIPLTIMIFVYARIFQVTTKRNKMLKPYCTTFVFDKNRGFKRWRRETTGSHVTVASSCTMASCMPNHVGNTCTHTHTHTAVHTPGYERECDTDTDLEEQFMSKSTNNTPIKKQTFEAYPLRKLYSTSSTGSGSSAPEADIRSHGNRSVKETERNCREGQPGTPRNMRRVTVTCDSHAKVVSPVSSLDIQHESERDYFLRREEKRKERAALQRESKTAKTLAIVVGCFIVCWLPFFLMYLIEPFCTSCNFDPTMITLFTWLGYCNSVLNPLIYAFYNRDFRSSFWKLTIGLVMKEVTSK
jgi:hypothetical protein